MFDSSDVQSVFSGNIAEEWEKKSRYINSLNSLATFNSLYEYFMFLYAIGSLQKIFNYKGEYEYALKLITVFKNLFSKEETLSVDFNYSYITLKKK